MTFVMRMKRLWAGPALPPGQAAIAEQLRLLDRRWNTEPAYDGRPLLDSTLNAADIVGLESATDEIRIAIRSGQLVVTNRGDVRTFGVGRRT